MKFAAFTYQLKRRCMRNLIMISPPIPSPLINCQGATQTTAKTSAPATPCNQAVSFVQMLTDSQQIDAKPATYAQNNIPAMANDLAPLPTQPSPTIAENLNPAIPLQTQPTSIKDIDLESESSTLFIDVLQDEDDPLYCIYDDTRLELFDRPIEIPTLPEPSQLTLIMQTTQPIPQKLNQDIETLEQNINNTQTQDSLFTIEQQLSSPSHKTLNQTTSIAPLKPEAMKPEAIKQTEATIAIDNLTTVTDNKAIPDTVSHIVNQFSDYMNQATTLRTNENIENPTATKESAPLYQLKPDSIEQGEANVLHVSPYTFKIETYNAKLKVYPKDLGEIQAEIKLNPRGTELTLTTEHPEIRQWIESHLQGLRDAFQDANMSLIDVNFAASADSQQRQNDKPEQSKQSANTSNEPTQKTNAKKESRTEHQALVDTYA